MHKITRSFLSVMLILISGYSCNRPLSKEQYLERYEAMVNEVAGSYQEITEEKWKEYDEQFERYKREWYDKFEDEFTIKEKIRIAGFSAKYLYYRNLAPEVDTYLEMIEKEFKLLKEELKEYIENGLEEDIRYLLEYSKDVGPEEYEKVKKALQELDYEIIDEGEDAPPAI